jgi:hypothetical protein
VVASIPVFPVLINFALGLGWFGKYNQGAAAIALIYAALVFYFVTPTSDEIREEIKAEEDSKRDK